MSKRKSTNCVLSFEDVLNDINDWLTEENSKNDEVGDNLDELWNEEEEIDSNQSKECLEEQQHSEEPGDNVHRQQRYGPRNQLTRIQNVQDIVGSLEENNYKEVVFTNKDVVLEELCGYLGPMKDKNTKKIWWSSEHRVATGSQRKCNTISDRISCLAQKSRANNIENIEGPFHLYFDNDIMDKIVDCANTGINETVTRWQRSKNFSESSKYTWVKKIDTVEIYAFFGLMYFTGILGVNLHMTDRLFSNDNDFVFGAIMSKNRFRFRKGHICFNNSQERTQLWETDRFAAVREIWEIFNSNLSKHVASSEYLSIHETLYPMRQQYAILQYNPNKPHRHGLLLKSLNDARFPYTYKAVPYVAKPKAGDGPFYLKSIIDYIKYLVNEMEADQPFTSRTISTDCL